MLNNTYNTELSNRNWKQQCSNTRSLKKAGLFTQNTNWTQKPSLYINTACSWRSTVEVMRVSRTRKMNRTDFAGSLRLSAHAPSEENSFVTANLYCTSVYTTRIYNKYIHNNSNLSMNFTEYWWQTSRLTECKAWCQHLRPCSCGHSFKTLSSALFHFIWYIWYNKKQKKQLYSVPEPKNNLQI